jgi:hypothetical protein
METVRIKTSELLQMQHTIQTLEMQLNSIRKLFYRFVASDNEDLRMIAKQVLQETDENPEMEPRFIPEITEGDKSVSPVLLAGKWSDLNINAKQLRKEAWREY